MASRRRNATGYDTYGSVAYAPAYDGSAVRVPRREEELQTPRPRRREQQRRHALTRTHVQVREAGQVAPFAVVGFFAVAILAGLLLMGYARLTMVSGEMVGLRSQLTSLQKEHATLSAEYEKVFDMDTIEQAVGGDMVRPTDDQVVYIDLSELDTVVVHGEEGGYVLTSVLDSVRSFFGGVIEYFR